MRLSIIIPVYNVEQWVGRCLGSCLNQDIPKDDYEIICVDDGSTDNSRNIIEKYAEVNSNIVILHQENAGQSSARNNALKIAKGKYVWFVDSDDWIEFNCIGPLLYILDKGKLDILCFSFQFVEENREICPRGYQSNYKGTLMNGREFIVKVPMPAGPWAAIHRKDFLKDNDISFIEGIKREDEDFTVRAYCSANRIEYVDYIAYNYFQRIGSTMKSANNPKFAYDLLVVADSLYSFASNKLEKSTDAYNAVLNHASFAFSQALAYYDKRIHLLSEFRNKPYYPLAINSLLTNRENCKYRLINFSLRIYLLIYKLMKR